MSIQAPLNRRHRIYPVQMISQVWNGVGSIGSVAATGGFEDVLTIGHDISQLGSGDIGGPFLMHRSLTQASYGACFKGAGSGSEVALHPPLHANLQGLTEPETTDMWALGGTAIARCAPDQTAFDVQDFLAQSIQGGIPKAIGSATWRATSRNVLDVFRSGGSEYLNVQFGWLPLVNDVMSFCRTVKRASQIVNDLKDGSGKKTREGYAFPSDTQSASTNTGPFLYSWDSTKTGWSGGGKFTTTTINQSKDWFKGCFTYVIPVDSQTAGSLDRYRNYADHILGVGPRINPEILWDASPWSWAVDWAVNVGDVAHNIGQFSRDGLVMQYGYFMSSRITNTTATFSGGTVSSGCTTTTRSEFKKRIPASPYGFGLTYDGLSASQKSILTAIGISHF